MNKTSVFAVGLAVLLSTRLGQAQAAEGTATAAPAKPAPVAPTAADGAAKEPAAAAAPPETGPVAPLDPAGAGESRSVRRSTAKQRAIELQQRRIQTLSKRIQEAETAAKAPSATPEQQKKAKASVAADRVKQSAAVTAIDVLEGEKVPTKLAETALAVEQEEHAALEATGAAAAEVEASEVSRQALEKAASPASELPADKNHQEVELPKGDRLRFGPTVSVLRVSALRNPGEPGRYRNYESRYEFVPAEFGFQFLFAPHNEPWRYRLANAKNFQLLSAGGMLLARIDKDDVQRGNLSIAATLSLFQEVIGIGVGVDLYRGVPIQGADGKSGGDTAFTGLLAWSLTRRGEVTPENVFFVVSLGLEPLVRSVTGEL